LASSSTSNSKTALLDLNSNKLEDLQFQAKMNYYDEIVARAERVMERERQRLEREALDNAIQSDSELSVLASSLFNGIEGIESGQGIITSSSGIEMGGTSSLPNQGDSEQGGSINSGIGTQSNVISPWRTRSGKILQRIE